MPTMALIPVKELSEAKARLAAVLDEPSRRELVVAMLRDVLGAAMGCAALDGAVVVTRDEDVASIAAAAGAEAIAEPGNLNEALASAAETLRARSVDRLVVLTADVPLADGRSIATVLAADAQIVIAPSRDGGTNALALAPGAIPFRFGPDSARQHAAEAKRAGLRCVRIENERLALDIDTSEDLNALVARIDEAGAHTSAALERLGLVAPAA